VPDKTNKTDIKLIKSESSRILIAEKYLIFNISNKGHNLLPGVQNTQGLIIFIEILRHQ